MLLCIECSGKPLSLALFENQTLRGELVLEPTGPGHAERLLPAIDSFFKSQKIKLSDITAFALTIGPGSFTSLRIGVVTVLGLSSGQPVFPVSTLEVLAFQEKNCAAYLAPVIAAGRGRVIGACYDAFGKMLVEEGVRSPEDFLKLLKPFEKELAIVGPGAHLLKVSSEVFPIAKSVGEFVFYKKLQPISADSLRIQYLQEPDLG